MKNSHAIAAIVLGVVAGYQASQHDINVEQERAEYCARVVAGAQPDFRNLCPAGSFNSYRGLPGDVSPRFVNQTGE